MDVKGNRKLLLVSQNPSKGTGRLINTAEDIQIYPSGQRGDHEKYSLPVLPAIKNSCEIGAAAVVSLPKMSA
jgi:hypothetical protein